MTVRRQPIIWTNDGLVYWRIYASLGLNELSLPNGQMLECHIHMLHYPRCIFNLWQPTHAVVKSGLDTCLTSWVPLSVTDILSRRYLTPNHGNVGGGWKKSGVIRPKSAANVSLAAEPHPKPDPQLATGIPHPIQCVGKVLAWQLK